MKERDGDRRLVGKTKSSGSTRLDLKSGCEGGMQHYQEPPAQSPAPAATGTQYTQKNWLLCCQASKDLFHSILLHGVCLMHNFRFHAFLLMACNVLSRAISVNEVGFIWGQADIHWLPLTGLENIAHPGSDLIDKHLLFRAHRQNAV